MSARTWSTTDVSPREGLAYWRDAVCQAVLNVDTERPDVRFSARISGQRFGDLRFAAFTATPHAIVRERRHVARADAETCLISLQRRGRSRMRQADNAFELQPGEIAILDGEQPFSVGFPHDVSRVLAVIPRRMLESRAPWLMRPSMRKISAASPYADLTRRHLLHLSGDGGLRDGEASLLSDNLCNLLALATAPQSSFTQAPADIQVEAILAYCRNRLADPALNPSRVAAHFAISVRTLHLRFERVGNSFGRWMLENRLDACHRALRDEANAGVTIAEVAYRWGFSDLSHFGKAFRARFGVTPGNARVR